MVQEHGILKDARKYLEEDIFLYGSMLILNLAWDFLLNLAIAVHAYHPTHMPDGQPYSFGVGQIIMAVFCAIQLFRKWNDWRYT